MASMLVHRQQMCDRCRKPSLTDIELVGSSGVIGRVGWGLIVAHGAIAASMCVGCDQQ